MNTFVHLSPTLIKETFPEKDDNFVRCKKKKKKKINKSIN